MCIHVAGTLARSAGGLQSLLEELYRGRPPEGEQQHLEQQLQELLQGQDSVSLAELLQVVEQLRHKLELQQREASFTARGAR